MKKAIAFALLSLVLLFGASACSGNNQYDNIYNSNAGGEALSPGASAVLATPADPSEMEITYELSGANLRELYNTDGMFVFLGTVQDDGQEWNSVRDENDLSKPSDTHFMMDMSYSFQIIDCLKGGLQKNDVVKFNIPYRDKFPGDADFIMNQDFIAPIKGNTYLIFVKQDPSFEDIYYPDTLPYSFELKEDGKLYIYVKKDENKGWNEGRALAGISLEDAKKEMTGGQ